MCFLTRLLKGDETIKHSVIRERHRGKAQFRGSIGEVAKPAGTIEERVFRMDVEMNKRRAARGHRNAPYATRDFKEAEKS